MLVPDGIVSISYPERGCDAMAAHIGQDLIGYVHYALGEGASWRDRPVIAECSDFTFEPISYGGPHLNAQFRRQARVPKPRPSLKSILKTLDRKARNGVFAHIAKVEETPELPF